MGQVGAKAEQVGDQVENAIFETLDITSSSDTTFFPRMLWQNATMTSYNPVERQIAKK